MMLIERTNLINKLPCIVNSSFPFELKSDSKHLLEILPKENLYTLKDIQKLCIDYRLRFLDAQHYKLDFPSETFSRIGNFEKLYDIPTNELMIVAPSKAFILKKADDPLLFASLGNGLFYLIHQWGNDLHPFRKLLVWPLKNFYNLSLSVLIVSFLLTLMAWPFSPSISLPYQILLFLFVLKSLVGVVLYYCFASGFQFSESSWQSRYQKAV